MQPWSPAMPGPRRPVLCLVPKGKWAVGWGEQMCLQEGKWGSWDGAGQVKNHR